MSRLFIAVWPPPAVVRVLRDLPRPSSGLRWSTPEQWHVTLRYLGKVDEAVALAAFETTEGRRCEAALGPALESLGPEVIVAPVAGLDELAAAVEVATGHIGDPPHPDGFRGHLTLARVRRSGSVAPSRTSLSARFAVDEIALVRSELHADGARYTTVARRSLSA